MTTFNFGALVEQAKAEGFSNENLVGNYNVEVATVNAGTTQGGSPQVGIRLKVIDGPKAGASTWDNISFPKVNPDGTAENPKAAAAFVSNLLKYGIAAETLATLTSAEQIAALIPVGAQYAGTFSEVKGSKGDRMFQRVGKLTPLSGIPTAPPIATMPAPAPVQVPPAPVPAPAPQQAVSF